jgi:hypothetical protein
VSLPEAEQDDLGALAERVIRRLLAIDDIELRAATAASDLGALDAHAARALLGLLLRSAGRSTRASEALIAVVDALQNQLVAADALAAIAASAEEAGDDEVRRLVAREPPPRRGYDPADEVFFDAKMSSLTLGHRRALARARDPDLIARLAHDQDPAVVRNLLVNPRITERVVLRIAARRPVRPEVLDEVLRSPRWSRNTRVRTALAQNPYAPIALAVRALATLLAPELREIVRDANLHPEVRDAARKVIEGRSGRGADPARNQAPELPEPPEPDDGG